MRTRRLPLLVPNLVRLHYMTTARLSRRRGLLLLGVVTLLTIFSVLALSRRFGSQKHEWPKLISDPPTLVFRREDLQRIWKWEVESGHYPSSRTSKSR
jgi:DDB1- and CUL4-associated factor 13